MLYRLAVVLLALLLAGCSLGQPIARQAVDYNASIEAAANTLLVRNILRARDEAPLHFTTLPQIRGSLTLGLGQPGLGLPVGGAGSTSGLTLGLGAATSPSFDVSALDTQEFARGLQEPLEPSVIRHYLERGYPQPLLLMLMFSAVEEPATGTRHANDPRCWLDRPDCPDPAGGGGIREALRATGAMGRFIFHPFTGLTPVGPLLTPAQAADPALLALLGDGRFRLVQQGSRFRLYRVEERVAACRRVQIDGHSMMLPLGPLPAAAPQADAPVCVSAEVTMPEMVPTSATGVAGQEVYVRSVLEIIRFLGLLVRVQEAMPPAADGGPGCVAVTLRPGRQACLFRLGREDGPPIRRTAFTVEHGGATWRMPAFAEADGQLGDYSLQVLALVTELVNLKKSSASIPSTRAVQLVR